MGGQPEKVVAGLGRGTLSRHHRNYHPYTPIPKFTTRITTKPEPPPFTLQPKTRTPKTNNTLAIRLQGHPAHQEQRPHRTSQ